MSVRHIAASAGFMVLAGTVLMSFPQPVQALTMKECSAKYQAAKSEARGKCRISHGGFAEIFERVGGKGADAHLPRSIQRQQGDQRQRRAEMDPEGRRLLQRVQQAAEGLS